MKAVMAYNNSGVGNYTPKDFNITQLLQKKIQAQTKMNGTIAEFELKRKDNFLLLRIIAALLVIYGHSYAVTQIQDESDIFVRFNWGRYSGELAVSAFFIMSGFMITGSYLRKNSILAYLFARFLRITPALVIVVLASVFVIGPLVTKLTLKEYFSASETYAYLTKNITYWSSLSWNLPGVFESHRYQAVNGSLWTIPAEVRMYVVIVLLGITGLLTRKLLFTPVLLLAFIFSIYDPSIFSNNIDAVRLGGYFCLGIIAQLYKKQIPVRHSILMVLIISTFFSRNAFLYFYLLTLSTAYFCFWFAYKVPHIPLEKFGDPSYGIYLWGWPIQQLIVYTYSSVTPYINCIMAMFVALIIGYLSWHLVEARCLEYKMKLNWEPLKLIRKPYK